MYGSILFCVVGVMGAAKSRSKRGSITQLCLIKRLDKIKPCLLIFQGSFIRIIE